MLINLSFQLIICTPDSFLLGSTSHSAGQACGSWCAPGRGWCGGRGPCGVGRRGQGRGWECWGCTDGSSASLVAGRVTPEP